MNQDFFSKLWKCPFRRSWRYGRKFLFVLLLGIAIWMSLDFIAIIITMPHFDPPMMSLLTHSLLTILLSFLLTLSTHQLSIRRSSRFRLIRAFQTQRGSPHDWWVFPTKARHFFKRFPQRRKAISISQFVLHNLDRFYFWFFFWVFIYGRMDSHSWERPNPIWSDLCHWRYFLNDPRSISSSIKPDQSREGSQNPKAIEKADLHKTLGKIE